LLGEKLHDKVILVDHYTLALTLSTCEGEDELWLRLRYAKSDYFNVCYLNTSKIM